MSAFASQPEEHRLYPWHHEDDVPQGSLHLDQCSYLKKAIKLHRPNWRVESDLCLYWIPRNFQKYRAADLAVVDGPTPEQPSNYLAWSDGPVLFVAEAASENTRDQDRNAKFKDYEQALKAREYLYFDSHRGEVHLWRLREGRYEEVSPDGFGRLWSEQLGLWFELDPNGLMRALTRDGRRLLTHEEEAERADAEARRADTEARRASAAENRADREVLLRQEKEAQLAEALAELERLRGRD